MSILVKQRDYTFCISLMDIAGTCLKDRHVINRFYATEYAKQNYPNMDESLKAKEIDYEVHIDDTDPDYWHDVHDWM